MITAAKLSRFNTNFQLFLQPKDATLGHQEQKEAADRARPERHSRRGSEATEGEGELPHHVRAHPVEGCLRAEPVPRTSRRS